MDFELVELEGSICANSLSLCIVYIFFVLCLGRLV